MKTTPKDIISYKELLKELHQRLVMDANEGEPFEQYDEDRWIIYSILKMIETLEGENQ